MQSENDFKFPESFPLASELILHEADSHGRGILEDERTGKFYRLGAFEYAFVHSLQLGKSPLEAWKLSRSEGDVEGLPEDAQRLMQWLHGNGLTQKGAVQGVTPSKYAWLAKPFYFQLPLFNPDRFLEVLVSHFGFLFSIRSSLIFLAIFVIGCLSLLGSVNEFTQSYRNLFTWWNSIWLVVVWTFLKVVHELGHGATCKRYGGSVRRAGLAFILFFPMAYTDVTSCWKFPSRLQRLHVSLAGVVIELGLAGVAMLAWHFVEAPAFRLAITNVILMASISTLLFNLNPLMRFDGYFALADFLGIDNLFTHATSYAKFWFFRYVLGMRPAYPRLPYQHAWWIRYYGLAVSVWRIVLVSGLIYGAAALLEGAGVVLALAGAFVFVLQPIWGIVEMVQRTRDQNAFSLVRLSARLGIVVTVLLVASFALPGDLRRTAPGIVEYDPPVVVRAPSDGFVEKVLVRSGESVQEGQLILVMKNEELEIEHAKVAKSLAGQFQIMRSARWVGNSSKFKEAQAEVRGLQSQLSRLKSELDELRVCAPCDGRVVSRSIETITGVYVQAGDEFAAIGSEERKRIKISVGIRQAKRWRDRLNQTVTYFAGDYHTRQGTLVRVDSRFSDESPDESLSTVNGGALAVFENEEGEWKLPQPRTTAYVVLSKPDSLMLPCGQRAFVRQATHRSLAQRIYQWFRESFRRFGTTV